MIRYYKGLLILFPKINLITHNIYMKGFLFLSMNIFYLDSDPSVCARYHVDKHVVKMILETAQILCTVQQKHGFSVPYKPTHKNHPCTLWAGKTQANFNWLKSLGLALCKEYTFRYGKIHKSQSIIENARNDFLPPKSLTTPALAMPDQYKQNDPIVAYRDYYCNEKKKLFHWKKREAPKWVKT